LYFCLTCLQHPVLHFRNFKSHVSVRGHANLTWQH
jgi:hypothetical protein